MNLDKTLSDNKFSSSKNVIDSLNLVDLNELNDRAKRVESDLKQSEQKQGLIGRAYDAMKNSAGTSRESQSLFARGWSYVLNADEGSTALAQSVQATKNAIASGDKSKLGSLIELKNDGSLSLKIEGVASKYDESQKAGVNFVADTAAMVSTATSKTVIGGIAKAMLTGAMYKAGLKAVDGAYSDFSGDLISGAVLGAATPLAGMSRKFVSNTATNFEKSYALHAVKTDYDFGNIAASKAPQILGLAVEGGMLGHVQQWSGEFEAGRTKGKDIADSFTAASKIVTEQPTGLLFGAAGGAVLGKILKAPKPADIAFTNGGTFASGLGSKEEAELTKVFPERDAANVNKHTSAEAFAVDPKLPTKGANEKLSVLLQDPQMKTLPEKFPAPSNSKGKVNMEAISHETESKGSSMVAHDAPIVSNWFKLQDSKSWMEQQIANLTPKIVDLIKSKDMSVERRLAPLESVPATDRALAQRVLNHSFANINDQPLLNSMNSVAITLNNELGSSAHSVSFHSASAESSGSMLAYITRKVSGGDNPVALIGDMSNAGSSITPKVVFGSPANMTEAVRNNLVKSMSEKPGSIYFVDTSAFDKLPNFVDYAKGSDAVAEKLKSVTSQVRKVMERDGKSFEDAIDSVVHGDFDKALTEIANELPEGTMIHGVKPTQTADFGEELTETHVKKFLQTQFGDPQQRLDAAQSLLSVGQFKSFLNMADDAKALGKNLRVRAEERGLNTENDLYVVGGTYDDLKSDGLVGHLLHATSELKSSQFISAKRLMKMVDNPYSQSTAPMRARLRDARIILLDDALYTGDQMLAKLNQFEKFDNVTVAATSTYSDFNKRADVQKMFDGHKRDLVTVYTDIADLYQAHPYASQISERLSNASVQRAYGQLGTLKVLPYMTSDTSLYWIQEFASRVMHVPSRGITSKLYEKQINEAVLTYIDGKKYNGRPNEVLSMAASW
ncbi:MAG TPA: hypothetical protein V6C76_11400 [Drouetiella sp.]